MRTNAPDWRGTRVLITGVCGTIGRALLGRLLRGATAQVVGLDIDGRRLRYLHRRHRADGRIRLVQGDIREATQLLEACRGVDIVLHAAAMKDIVQCERDPVEAVRTNVLGTQAVIEAARTCGVARVAFLSTDKAANPTSILGASKLAAEKLVSSAVAERRGAPQPVFVIVRLGNVLGSSGSVVPVFARQIAHGNTVTLTDPLMTRFVMTLNDAVEFIMTAVLTAGSGEIHVRRMAAVRIVDLASVMMEALATPSGHRPECIPITVIGRRPGEKLYEELIGDDEASRTLEYHNGFVVMPLERATRSGRQARRVVRHRLMPRVRSDRAVPMGRAQVRSVLRGQSLLNLRPEERSARRRLELAISRLEIGDLGLPIGDLADDG